ncbi:MAG TPA: myo-inosose-2 dehydratase [Myxococcales bacterium LLY-WYZ-16_1]|nr:myo-inosose-2 dehydratase [Myxococcales bacterium LLY-WYZ-16_1]
MTAVGVSPVGWANDDFPGLGSENSFRKIVAEASRAGYEGIELGRRFPADPMELARGLREHGLTLVAGWHGSRLLEGAVDEELRRMEPRLELLRKLDCPRLVVGELTGAVHRDRGVPLSKRPLLHPEGLRRFGEALTLLADALEARGTQLLYHPHMGTAVQSEDDVDALMAATGESVRLCLDVGHLLFAKADPFRVLSRHRTRVGHVHLKDVRPGTVDSIEAQNGSFADAVVEGVFTVPGDSRFDFETWLARLFDQPYDGWLVVEADQDPDRADPLVYASIGRNSLRRWLGA